MKIEVDLSKLHDVPELGRHLAVALLCALPRDEAELAFDEWRAVSRVSKDAEGETAAETAHARFRRDLGAPESKKTRRPRAGSSKKREEAGAPQPPSETQLESEPSARDEIPFDEGDGTDKSQFAGMTLRDLCKEAERHAGRAAVWTAVGQRKLAEVPEAEVAAVRAAVMELLA